MIDKNGRFSKFKVWSVFVVLFVCGLMAGIGIANWNGGMHGKQDVSNVVPTTEESLTSCQAIESVLESRLYNRENDCAANKDDLEVYKKLMAYGCPENNERYAQAVKNLTAVLAIACDEVQSGKTCLQIERDLQVRLPSNYVGASAQDRIDRAKIYAVMAERGCPENSSNYVELAKQELEIARAVQDDKFNEDDTIEVVETYKRLKMQKDAEEIFNKAKKLTNPAIDFIMQVEKIINE